MLKNGKSANRNELQNEKNRSFLAQKPKNRTKNSQNRKTENPNVPLKEKLKLCIKNKSL